jgi:translocation and assembly module TamB
VTEPAARPRRWWKYLLITGGIAVAAGLLALWYTTTASFQAYVRGRMIAELEQITGGRAEIGSFHVVPFHMQVEVRDITVHGKEASADVPLFHADHLYAQMKVVSFLRTEFGFYALTLEHPVVHIAIQPDGTTNVPSLAVSPRSSANPPIEQLFALSIDHLSVKDGELLWADRKIPLDFVVHDSRLQMDYSFLHGRYESHLELGKVDTTVADLRPFSWTASVDFSLGTTFADIKALKWNSGKSSVEAGGRVSDFGNPHLGANYLAHIDLEDVRAIARRRDLRGGVAEFKGSGQWSLSELATSGTLNLRDLDWQGDQIAIKKAAATSDYSLSDDQIKLSKLEGKLFGGSFTGEAQVDHWLHSIPAPRGKATKGAENMPIITAVRPPVKKGEKAKSPGVETGSVHLRMRDFSAAEMAAALDTTHRMANFHPAGLAAGTMDAVWKGSVADAELSFAAEVSPPPHPGAHELPLSVRAEGKYYFPADALELSQFNLSTPASRMQAQGMLSPSSALHLSVSTTNLEEWRPVVAALGGPTNLPFRVDGNAVFNGVVGGAFSSPTLSGTLVAQDFEFTLPATSRTPEQQVHWDSLATNLQFSFHNLAVRGGTLRRGDTSADFDVTALLQNGQFTPYSPYSARVNLRQVDVASTAALAGFDYPISGTADVSLVISGTRAHPQVVGHIHATNAAAYGESIETFDTDLRIADTETTLNNIRLTHQDAEITGNAAYTPDTQAFRLDLIGKNFDLSRVRQIHLDRLPIEGRGDFTLQGSGTLNAPVINASAQVRDLMLGHEAAGGLELAAATEAGEMRVSGHSDFSRGAVVLEGNIGMHGEYPANLSVHMDRLDLDALWRAWLGEQLTGHSAISGTVTLEGPLSNREQWALDGNLTGVTLDVEYAKLHNQDPVRFTYSQQTLHLAPLHLVGEGTDIRGSGSIHLTGSRELDLAADGQLDLKLLDRLDPELTASGLAMVRMTVAGTLSQPLPQGTIEIKNGAASHAGLPSGLSEMNGSLTFNRATAHIEDLTARTGGGTVNFKGDATDYNRQLNFNLTAVGKDVRLRYPPGVSSTANGELHWVGNRTASIVSGDVLVTKLAVTPGFDFGSYLEQTRKAAAITTANSPLYNVKLDVAVRTAPELQMKTAVARLSGDADLRLRGSAARPSVLGRADILEGDATFNGIKFRLERGDITFANPVAIEPQVNLQATTHVRNYDLEVTVTGTPERLTVNYRSEPPLPKSDIIALLALGRTTQEYQQLQQQSGQAPFSDEATNLIINQAINQTVSSRLQKLFGVSRIKIDPQGLTTETNPTARGPQVTIEQQFANNVSLTYSTNVSQSSQQIIQGEYFFTRNISATATRDQNGVVSFDVRVRRRRK